MPTFNSALDTSSANFQKNKTEMLEMIEVMEKLLLEASQGGGNEATERLRSRGKLPIRERISLLLDRDSPFLEISALAAWRSPFNIGSGFVVGIGVVKGI